MPPNDRSDSEKDVSKTIRLPPELNKSVGHLLVETNESFQEFAVRLIKQELSGNPNAALWSIDPQRLLLLLEQVEGRLQATENRDEKHKKPQKGGK